MTRSGAKRRVPPILITVVLVAASALAAARAQTSWTDVQILVGTTQQQMDLFMQAMSVSLGVECEHCHDPEAFGLPTETKEVTRSMMRMISEWSTGDFEALAVPSCWTCHRGAAIPQRVPPPVGEPAEQTYPESTFSASLEPARDAYVNVQLYGDLPARELAGVMESYSAALGVDCQYCHVEGNWASDERVEKLLSRRMVEIQRGSGGGYFAAADALSCWTCHRGEATPDLNIPPGRMPGA